MRPALGGRNCNPGSGGEDERRVSVALRAKCSDHQAGADRAEKAQKTLYISQFIPLVSGLQARGVSCEKQAGNDALPRCARKIPRNGDRGLWPAIVGLAGRKSGFVRFRSEGERAENGPQMHKDPSCRLEASTRGSNTANCPSVSMYRTAPAACETQGSVPTALRATATSVYRA
jgi:hypothetical protein